uniref:ATP-dependent Clp protease proteolytic subunit n=1 Tax=Helianthus annuus TaxID=4232 RepID=A0A251RYW0_HELAN
MGGCTSSIITLLPDICTRSRATSDDARAVLKCYQSTLSIRGIIRCGGAVDDDMANIIVAQLLYLDAVDPNKDIVMYVNSPGGSVTAGMAIFDTMKHIRPDVSTVCVGLAARLMKCWHHKTNLNGYLAYDTGQSIDRINQDTDRNYFMSAKESKEYGLIDGVIMNPLKALQPLAAA